MLVQTEDITNSKQSFTAMLGVLVIPVYNHTIKHVSTDWGHYQQQTVLHWCVGGPRAPSNNGLQSYNKHVITDWGHYQQQTVLHCNVGGPSNTSLQSYNKTC